MEKNVFDNGITRKYMNTETILKYVTEADIFELVFGFKPKEFDYVTSPFRKDTNPDCWFENSGKKGSLRFKDFADDRVIRGVKMRNIGCFDAIMVYYNLSFSEAISFIIDKLIYGEDLECKEELVTKEQNDIRKEAEIYIDLRQFIVSDKNFWFDSYGISKANLIEDRVFPISRYKVITSSKKFTHLVRTNTYCFTDFKGKRKKIYAPFQKGKGKFITNCNENDVGGLYRLPDQYDKLVITKSYKDYRVLKNQGLNVVWFQNEGMFPDLEILLPMCHKSKEVVIFFDNDQTGIHASETLKELINSFIPNIARIVHLPESLLTREITDPSDFIKAFGRNSLLDFLSKYLIL